MYAYAAADEVAKGFLAKLNSAIVYPLITLMLTVAFIIFLYGCFEFIANSSSDSARSTGRRHIMWGIIGMLIMVSAYAILSIAAGTFGLSVPK